MFSVFCLVFRFGGRSCSLSGHKLLLFLALFVKSKRVTVSQKLLLSCGVRRKRLPRPLRGSGITSGLSTVAGRSAPGGGGGGCACTAASPLGGASAMT